MKTRHRQQQGSILILCLIMLTAATVLFMTGLKQSILNIRIISAEINRDIIFHTTTSEINAQYNFLMSELPALKYLEKAIDNSETPLLLRGDFDQFSIKSNLEFIPLKNRFKQDLNEGYSTGLFSKKTFSIIVSAQSNSHIKSNQKIQFSVLTQTKGL